MTTEQITALGNYWERGTMRRVYFNNLAEWLGLKVYRYNSGNISSATLNGETISNGAAQRMIGRLQYAKVYYDITTSSWHGKDIEQDDLNAIIAAIEAHHAAQTASDTSDDTVSVDRTLASDPTTPAGATREASLIRAIDAGWTEAEIAAGVRFKGRETFICAGCGLEFPRSLAMSASLGTSCPDCYDDLSG